MHANEKSFGRYWTVSVKHLFGRRLCCMQRQKAWQMCLKKSSSRLHNGMGHAFWRAINRNVQGRPSTHSVPWYEGQAAGLCEAVCGHHRFDIATAGVTLDPREH